MTSGSTVREGVMYQLRVLSGSKAGQAFPLTPGQTLSVGRGDATISVPEDQTLSRLHAEVAPAGGGWVLRNKSQHGSLVAGQVVHAEVPLTPGTELQVGGTRLVFEAATGAQAAAAPQPGGAPVGGDEEDEGAGAKAGAGLQAGLATVAPAFAQGGGRVEIDGSAPGFPFGDLIKGGITIARANLVGILCAALPGVAIGIVFAVVQFAAGFLPAIVALVLMLALAVAAAAVNAVVMFNLLAAVRRYQLEGTPITLGSYLRFDDLVPRLICLFIVGLSSICCYIPPIFLAFSLPLLVDKPQLGFVGALKTSFAFTKKNLVPTLILLIVCGITASLGSLACGVGGLFTMPVAVAAFWLAYECKRADFDAAAAEAGFAA